MTRKPRKITARSLENGALYYLERYSTSAENLRRVLTGRLHRAARHHATDMDAGAAMIDELIARFQEDGLLDDARYALARAQTFRRQGNSARTIRGKLMNKGVPAGVVEETLATLTEESPQAELAAAVATARRRHLGPFRTTAVPGGERDVRALKDLAALARAGFSYAVAQRVIAAETAEELEDGLME
jgi:regulatory protein